MWDIYGGGEEESVVQTVRWVSLGLNVEVEDGYLSTKSLDTRTTGMK